MKYTLPESSGFDLRRMCRRFMLEWVVGAMALLGIAVVLGWMWKVDRDTVEEREKERLITTATIVERNATVQLDSINNALQGFISRSVGWQRSSAGLQEANNYFDAVAEAVSGINILFYADKDGVIRAATASWRQYIGRSIIDRPYYKFVRENASPDLIFISEPFSL